MAILLSILKWLGIILLILLLLLLLILLLVLFVPFRYKVHAKIDDPESHEEFPFSVLKERSDVLAQVSWLLGAIKVIVSYPSREVVSVKVFGRDIGIMKKLKKETTEEQEEEEESGEEEQKEEETSLTERGEALLGKAEKYVKAGDCLYRTLTGSCGRRAYRKVKKRLTSIVLHVLPEFWKFRGIIGLSDPCLNGKAAEVMAVLMPFTEDHLEMETVWDLYRCDLRADMAGKLRLAVPVKEAVPLIFDKDCKKVLRKLKKVRAKLK